MDIQEAFNDFRRQNLPDIQRSLMLNGEVTIVNGVVIDPQRLSPPSIKSELDTILADDTVLE